VSADTLFGGLEVWRGAVNTWECDQMGHMNVRFYVAHAMEGLAGLAAALGLPGAFRANAEATLLVKDHHIRFLREARAGAPLYLVTGVVEMGESEARLIQLLVHAGSGELAASFQTLVVHATSREERAFPWSDRTRALAAALVMEVPERAAPRSLTLEASAGGASLAEAERLDLIHLAKGAFTAQDCDVFGRVGVEHIIGRVSDGVPTLGAALGGGPRREGVGGAVLEYRSGLMSFDDRSQRVAHWVLDPETGAPWATGEAVAVSLDLAARKIIPLADEAKGRLKGRVTPGLSL
jgi:acyl-CoA thioester hydrolase